MYMEVKNIFKNVLGEIKSRDFIENKYTLIEELNDNRALVKDMNGLYGYIDASGNEVIPCKYYNAHSFNDGLALVVDEKKDKFVIDQHGTKVFNCNNYRKTSGCFSNGLLLVLDDYYGFVDKKGNKVISGWYVIADDFHEEMALVSIDLMDGSTISFFIDKNNEIKFVEQNGYYFEHGLSYFNNGIAPVFKEQNLYGYITKDGEILTKNLDELKALHNQKVEYQVVNEEIKEKAISYCSEVTVFGKTFTLKGKTEEELKNKKEELYQMIVLELQKLTLQDEKDSPKISLDKHSK